MIKYGVQSNFGWARFTISDTEQFAGFSYDGKFATYDINGAFGAAEDLCKRGYQNFCAKEIESKE